MPDVIKKSKFQLEHMKATMFGGTWVKDMPFSSFKCNDVMLQAFDFKLKLKLLIFIVRLAFLPYLLFRFNASDKSFIKIQSHMFPRCLQNFSVLSSFQFVLLQTQNN